MESLIFFAERVALLRDKAAEGNSLSAAALPAAEALLRRATAALLHREVEAGRLVPHLRPAGLEAGEMDWSVSL